MLRRKIFIGLVFCLIVLTSCGKEQETAEKTKQKDLRSVMYSLVSSAENSSLDYKAQYGYIEDIGDGRGYTAGLVGFTSGTGDLLEVVERYVELKPDNNPLEKYLPALRTVNGTDSHTGLGDNFVSDWIAVSSDKAMVQAQNDIVDEMYYLPAEQYAKEDGLSSLGQFIYYDALVMHGPGEDEESFGGIRKAAITEVKVPAKGGDESAYLLKFIEKREQIMLREEAHSDLSRTEAQRKFIREKNFSLEPPLTWIMYGDRFELE